MNSSVLEKSLLSTMISGNYLSSYDIVKLGDKLDIKLPYKKRSLILQKLFIHVRETNKQQKLTEEFISLLNKKEQKYKALSQNYKNSSPIIGIWLKKLNSMKRLVQHHG